MLTTYSQVSQVPFQLSWLPIKISFHKGHRGGFTFQSNPLKVKSTQSVKRNSYVWDFTNLYTGTIHEDPKNKRSLSLVTCDSSRSDATQMGKYASAESDEGPPFHIKISPWEFHLILILYLVKIFFPYLTNYFCLSLSLCSKSFNPPEFKSQRLSNLNFYS